MPTPRILWTIAALTAFSAYGPESVAWAQTASIEISKVADLDFGRIVSGSSPGAVTVSPAGVRTATGGTHLAGGTFVSAAAFTVTGEPLTAFAISLPASTTLSSGGGSMTLDAFESSVGATTTLDESGDATFEVGATLNLDAAQATGTYSGPFDVRIDYN